MRDPRGGGTSRPLRHNFANVFGTAKIFYLKVELDFIFHFKEVPKIIEIPIVYGTIGQNKRFFVNNRNFLNFDYFWNDSFLMSFK